MSKRPHLAVVGGGQLARMMQPPAVALGLRVRLLAEGPDVSAAQVFPDHRVGDHTVLDDLLAVCADAPVVTFDHEHVPPEHLRALAAAGHEPRPGPDALLLAQDKGEMRVRLSVLGLPCPLFLLLPLARWPRRWWCRRLGEQRRLRRQPLRFLCHGRQRR